jgi:hypothetical protein
LRQAAGKMMNDEEGGAEQAAFALFAKASEICSQL